MIPLTIPALLEYLKKEKFDAKLQSVTNQIYIVFKKEGHEFPLFIKVAEEGKILQLIVFLPGSYQAKNKGDLARLLHFINKEIDLPGFGMDETSGVLFYRAVLPFPEGSVNTSLLQNMLQALPHLAATFLPFITSTANGVSFETTMGKIKDALSRIGKSK